MSTDAVAKLVPRKKLIIAVNFLIEAVRAEMADDALNSAKKAAKSRTRKKNIAKEKSDSDETKTGRSSKKSKSNKEHSWYVRKRNNPPRTSTFQKDRSEKYYESKTQPFSFVDAALVTTRHFTITHNWLDASSSMLSVLEMLPTYPLVVWKLGSEILLNHSVGNRELINVFANKIINSCASHRTNVVLDHATYLFGIGDYTEGKRFIEDNPYMRLKQKIAPRKNETAYEIGYRALAEYFSWFSMKSLLDGGPRGPEKDDLSMMEFDFETGVHFERACDGFQAMLKCGGNLDVFVEKYVQMLESMDDWEKANSVLIKYTKTNAHHPSPFAFYEEFIKRRDCRFDSVVDKDVDAEPDLRLKMLKKLVKNNPSDARIMELFHLLDENDFSSRFKLLANTVDRLGWRNNFDVWNNLAMLVTSEVQSLDDRVRHRTLSKFVKDRASYWSSFHFNVTDICVDTLDSVNLNINKAIMAATIYSRRHPFVVAVKIALIDHDECDEEFENFIATLRNIPSSKIRRRHVKSHRKRTSSVAEALLVNSKKTKKRKLPITSKPSSAKVCKMKSPRHRERHSDHTTTVAIGNDVTADEFSPLCRAYNIKKAVVMLERHEIAHTTPTKSSLAQK